MARKLLTGDDELEAMLKHLADKSADRIAKAALGAGISAIAKELRKAAPVGPTGNMKASIGRRLEKARGKNKASAKAGLNVGKQTAKKKQLIQQKSGGRVLAPHAHLVALGTKERHRTKLGGRFAGISEPTEEQLSTGSMPANDFVRRTVTANMSKFQAAMRKTAAKRLNSEATRSRKTKR